MNQTPHRSSGGDDAALNDSVMQSLRANRWIGRVLVGAALTLGLVSIAASIVINWANAMKIMPMEQLLLQDYPSTVQLAGSNAEGKTPLSRDELAWRHIWVTVAQSKVEGLTLLSITLSSVGTFVVLLLVIFNRRVTLRQINANLAQISGQLKALQTGSRGA
jgi:hypothetical protein